MKIAIYANCGIGNFLMWSPFIRAARKFWEGCEIHIITEWGGARQEAIADICRRSMLIDGLKYIYLNGVEVVEREDEFEPGEFDKIVWSHHNQHDNRMREYFSKLRKGRVEEILELKNRGFIELPIHKWNELKIHEVEYYMSLLYDLGYKGGIPTMNCPRAKTPLLKRVNFRVAFCNGAFSHPLWEKKFWPVENWIELARLLKNYCGAEIVLVGGENLKEKHVGIPADQDFTGKLSITKTAKVIHQCDLMVTTDTGPMHMAAALNRPLIALFGSTHRSKNRPWMQSRKRARVIQHDEYDCVPCQDTPLFHECDDYKCMKAITPAEVMHEFRGMEKDGTLRCGPVYSC